MLECFPTQVNSCAAALLLSTQVRIRKRGWQGGYVSDSSIVNWCCGFGWGAHTNTLQGASSLCCSLILRKQSSVILFANQLMQ